MNINNKQKKKNSKGCPLWPLNNPCDKRKK